MNIAHYFKGRFVDSIPNLEKKLRSVKAFIFDWDGVFNNAHKDLDGSSSFSETDSMGINLLRFAHYQEIKTQPVVAIITGEHNRLAFSFAKREHFHAVYYRIKHKETALLHLCEQYKLLPSEVLFVFDDVLDFSAAQQAGARCMVAHSCNPLLIQFAIDNHLVDYITSQEGHTGAIREVSELVMSLRNCFNDTIQERMRYSDNYQKYISDRNALPTLFYSTSNTEIILQDPI